MPQRSQQTGRTVRRTLSLLVVLLVGSQAAFVGVSVAATGGQQATSPADTPAVDVSGDGVNATVAWHHDVAGETGNVYTRYANGRVYAVSSESITALDPDTGERLAQRSFSFETETVPNVRLSSSAVYVFQGGTARALDPASLEERWTHTFQDITNAVATPNHLVAAFETDVDSTSVKHTLVAVDATTGDVAWRKTLYDNTSDATVPKLGYDERVVFSYGDGLVGVDAETGDVAWNTDLTGVEWVALDGTIHLVTRSPPTASADGTYVVGLDSTDGQVEFERQTALDLGDRIGYQFAAAGGDSYFFYRGRATGTTHVVGFASGTGEQIFERQYDRQVWALTRDVDSRYLKFASSPDFSSETQPLSVLDTSSGDTASLSFESDATLRVYLGGDIEGTTLYSGTASGTVAAFDIGGSDTRTVPRAIAGSDGQIQLQELQQAIQYWATGEPVPNTGGETLDVTTLQELIQLWAAGQSI
jgi:outer membrane protein assembly factor BamB